MKKVLVYKPHLLPFSETFIKEQILAYRSWNGVLVGHRVLSNGLPLDGLDVRLLMDEHSGRVQELLWMIRRWMGVGSQSEARILRKENARIFHAHFGTVAVDIWPLVRAVGLPMVVTLHGYDINIYREWWEAGYGGFRRRAYPKKLLALAQEPRVNFIAVSDAIRQRAIEFGVAPEKIYVCYIGVDTKKFKPKGIPLSQRPHRVIFIGRLVENKGVDTLIQAYSMVAKRVPHSELIIVGDGSLRSRLEQQALAANTNIKFLGKLQHQQVKEILDTARVLCLPSRRTINGESEGFGMVILEAQASGVPVITSAVAGVTEGYIEGITGFSHAEGDADELASKIEKLLCDNELLEVMSSRSVEHVRSKFDIQNCTKRLEQLYDSFTH